MSNGAEASQPPVNWPSVIQGGMGVGISGWRLARAVSTAGGLGVVSGTALAVLMARRLQDGDRDGNIRRALKCFPDQDVVPEILSTYFLPNGRTEGVGYRSVPMYSLPLSPRLVRLTVAANFVEVFLAKEGHSGPIGINLLEKIQLPNISSLYGAMLAGVDYVLMGAGIPWEIPGALDRLARHESVTTQLQAGGASPATRVTMTFQPKEVLSIDASELRRPRFLAIVSSVVLAAALKKKANGMIDGFVVENDLAGGHNAPPRGASTLDERGEPIYGEKDRVDLEKIRALGLPFWVAGASGHPEKLREALRAGAAGVQVGTLFALCSESGLDTQLRTAVLRQVAEESVSVRTNPLASPTSFPFKVVRLPGTLSEEGVYADRPRRCDLGYLRHPYIDAEGNVGFRCPGEPVEAYLSKGGCQEDTIGRICLCNGLVADIGLAQLQPDGYVEPPLVTAGKDFTCVAKMMRLGGSMYSAAEALHYLESGP